MKSKSKNKSLPKFKNDKEAENFVRDADLTEYNFSEFKPMKFEFANKTARINMRLPEDLLDHIKRIAEKKDIPYTRFIRQILETVVEKERTIKSPGAFPK